MFLYWFTQDNAPNETVEKPAFQGANNPGRYLPTRLEHRMRFCRVHPIPDGLMERPKGVDFADIVHQSEQPPLYIHLELGA